MKSGIASVAFVALIVTAWPVNTATAQTKPYSASVVIDRDREHERFTTRIASSDGTERTLVGSTCEEVFEATVVVLALAISPSSPPAKATTPRLKAVQAAITPRDVPRPAFMGLSLNHVALRICPCRDRRPYPPDTASSGPMHRGSARQIPRSPLARLRS